MKSQLGSMTFSKCVLIFSIFNFISEGFHANNLFNLTRDSICIVLLFCIQAPFNSAINFPETAVLILQVERRVVNQIAAAHEKDLIKPGCTLKIRADYKTNKASSPTESLDSPLVKIQLIEEGITKDLNLEEIYQPDVPLFF